MLKEFRLRPNEAVEPWTLLFHQVNVLDEAAKIAAEDRDVDSLVEISDKIGQASNVLIEIYLLLSGDEQETEGSEEPRKNPVGFIVDHAEKESTCDCDEEQ